MNNKNNVSIVSLQNHKLPKALIHKINLLYNLSYDRIVCLFKNIWHSFPNRTKKDIQEMLTTFIDFLFFLS